MWRSFTNVFTTLAALIVVANLQAQGPGPGQRGGFGGMGMMGGPGGGGALMLVQLEPVQKEIDLQADQKEKLQALAAEQRDAMRARMANMQNLSAEERTAKMQDMRKEIEDAAAKTQKAVEGILLPHQLERVKQIQLQQQFAMGANMALAAPELQKNLGLTDDQKAKIKTINDDAMQAMRGAFTPGQPPSQADMDKMTKAREENAKKAMDVLTADQNEKLEKLKGPKFDTTTLFGGMGGNPR